MAPLDPSSPLRLSLPGPGRANGRVSERERERSQSAAIYDLFAASIPSPFPPSFLPSFLIFTCESCELVSVTHPPAHPGFPPSLLGSVVIWFGFGEENGNGIAPSMNIKGACRVRRALLARFLPRWPRPGPPIGSGGRTDGRTDGRRQFACGKSSAKLGAKCK